MSGMTPRLMKGGRAACWGLAIVFLSCLVVPQAAPAGSAKQKDELTGTFCQLDPEAGFDGDGSNFCAPTAIANGFLYLARARGMTDLVDGTDHKSQVALVKALAEHMETDPDIGTNPSKIIYGLQEYLQARGYSLATLEIAGWRRIDSEHRKFLVSRKPSLPWMVKAVEDPDTVLILNNGWYRDTEDGGCVRKGGHFVVAVGAGPGASQFRVHNPALEPDEQKTSTSVTLTPVSESIVADATSNGVEELELQGYYKMRGPGLPFTTKKAAFAALDFVIAFKVKK